MRITSVSGPSQRMIRSDMVNTRTRAGICVCAADVAGTQTTMAIRAPTADKCAILDMGAALQPACLPGPLAKCFTPINLENRFGLRAGNADEDGSRATKMTFRNGGPTDLIHSNI